MKVRFLCLIGLVAALIWLFSEGRSGGSIALSGATQAPVAVHGAGVTPPPPDLHGDRPPEQFLLFGGRPTDAGSAPAPIPPVIVPWSRLVFESYRDDNWEIYVADSNGSNQVRLTYDDAADFQPRLDRGCTRVAFASERAGNSDIWMMNPDGTGLARLTWDPSDDVNPAWSPDGSRIAFQSYRDGQAEIYVMSADGSGQTRLTWENAFDGQPTWSPDGSQIAFTSRRTGSDGIWAMNADGGNQHLLATQRYAQNPAWSPDGTQIAFDTDSDWDGWNEVMVMNADGTNQHQVYDGGYAVETWVRSWSADGNLIGLTRSLWTYYEGNWYWTESYLEAWDSGWGGQILPGAGTEWNPDWATTDIVPPTSNMAALPAQSPYRFTVRWAGSDAGDSGLRSYDVQIQDGAGGAWTDWAMATSLTSQEFGEYGGGIGGHTYYFRARARDNAYNVEAWPANYDAMTTVEALAPQTQVSPLPAFMKGSATVRWGGLDPGGSGIRIYDVQVRDGPAGAWTDWQTATTITEAEFTGTTGHTYYFRSRGVDNAQNVEPWPPGDGDAAMMFYAWALTSNVVDNRDAPLDGVTLAAAPSPITVVPSGGPGSYVAYFAEETATCSASWSKPGFTSLPATDLSGNADVRFDAVLPPGDNVVANWGFEQALTGWTAGGEISPTVTDTVRHTGAHSALLGRSVRGFKPYTNISQDASDSWRPQVAVDTSGAIHVVWGGDGIHYAHRDPGGVWSVAQKITGSALGSDTPQIALDASGNLHIVWTQTSEVYYARRDAGGTWSSAQNISGTPESNSAAPQLAVDEGGDVHVVWFEFNPGSNDRRIYYARRGSDGVWSAPRNLSGELTNCESPRLTVESAGIVHVVWYGATSDNTEVFYARRSATGDWIAPQNLSNSPGVSFAPALAIAADGRLHVIWSDNSTGAIDTRYVSRAVSGAWSNTETAATGVGGGDYPPQVAMDESGVIHVISGDSYMARSPAGGWSHPVVLGAAPHMVVTSNGVVHATWFGWPAGASEILYARRSSNGAWSSTENVSKSPGFSQFPRLALDLTGVAHLVWEDNSPGNMEVFYAEPLRAETGGDSELAQTLTVPSDIVNPTLSFLYRLEGAPENGVNWFQVLLQEGVTATSLFSTTTSAGDWSHRWFDLTSWKGKEIVLRFRVHQTAGRLPVWVYLDEITVGSAYPDAWVSKAGPETVPPGGRLTYTIHSGNRGGVLASSVRITDTLPAELTSWSAIPYPDVVALPLLAWDIGNLAPGSTAPAIVLQATVKPDIAPFKVFTNTVQITSASPEVALSNNQARAETLPVHLLYLPIIMK